MTWSLFKKAIAGGAFLLALVSAAGALAGQGGRFSDRLDALNHFAPLWLLGGLLAMGLWGLFVRREGGFYTMVLAAAAILSSGVLMAPELTAADTAEPAPPEADTIKVIQFNVWGRNGDPDGSVRWILEQEPDVVVLEEAYNAKSSVARQLRPHFSGRTTCAEPNPSCSTMIFYNREPLAEGGLVGTKEGPFLPAAWVTLPGPGGAFTVVGAHYTWPWPAGPQQAQGRRLADLAARFPKTTTIVAGDFNSTPWSFSLRRQDKALGLERRTHALPTWPASEFSRFKISAPFPILPIDHIYAGKAWRTVSVERGPRLGSDHYPVAATLARFTPGALPSPAKAVR